MIKRLGATGGVIVLAALAVGAVAPATGQGGDRDDDDRGEKIRVLSVNTEEDFADVGATGDSLGDAFVFTSDLTKHGKDYGHTGVVCTVTSLEREEVQCVGTAWLPGGQITVQGLLGGESTFSIAITGGTGHYEGAEGTLYVKELSDTEELLTFDLED